LLALPGFMQRLDKIRRVIIGYILQCVADAGDEIVLLDGAHVYLVRGT